MRRFIISQFLLISIISFSQKKEIVFNNFVELKDGIYSSYKEVLKNSPKYPNCELRIQSKLLDTAYHEFLDPNSSVHNYEDPLFAFVKNGALYVRLHRFLYKVVIKGAISIFNKNLMYNIGAPGGFYLSEDHIFIVDFQNGEIQRLNETNVEDILKNDIGLYNEFMRLSNSKKRKSLYPYILKYNERNTIEINE